MVHLIQKYAKFNDSLNVADLQQATVSLEKSLLPQTFVQTLVIVKISIRVLKSLFFMLMYNILAHIITKQDVANYRRLSKYCRVNPIKSYQRMSCLILKLGNVDLR